MGRGRKYLGKKKKGAQRPITKKKNKLVTEKEPINKKAIFNRNKNKQKVEEELAKKKQLERKLQLEQINYSESEEEEDVYWKLVAFFNNKVDRKRAIDSDDDGTASETSEPKNENQNMDEEKNNAAENSEDENKNAVAKESFDQVEQEDIANDPFTKHLQYDLSDELLVSLTSIPQTVENITKVWPVLGQLSITIPKPLETLTKKAKPKYSILEEETYAATGTAPSAITNVDFKQLYIKSQIHSNIVFANKRNLVKRDLELTEILTPLQKELFAIMNNYQDLWYPERTFSNADEIRYTYCLHAVNHMLKTRMKILHHNAKLAKKADVSDEYRDQGLVRPKVLIIVPFKDAAYRVVNTLIDILVPKNAGQVVNKHRFEEDFTGGEIVMPKKYPKPEDYQLMFSGNSDDTFRLGMALTKKTLKLYTDFYSSDIIVASPLGLRMIIGAEGEEERDYDFLATIEMLIMDQTDVFYMQNWLHLLHVFNHLHLQPKKAHDTNFFRVRSWAANGWSKYYRQTLVFSSIQMPEIKNIMNKRCQNYTGKVLVLNHAAVGSMQQIVLQVPQIFYRFNASSIVSSVDARFEYFVKEVVPKQRDSMLSHTLVYVPVYYDYVRIRNYFKKEDISFVQICEYSKDAKVARARDMFFHTEAHFMLYSERAHFFRRFRLKGIRHIIFYQPPTYPHFYSEMCNLMQEQYQYKYGGSPLVTSVSVLYCEYDVQRLVGVMGGARAHAALTSDKPAQMYVAQ